MKALYPLAALLLAIGIPTANAQAELAIANHTGACPNCSAKEQKILKLEAQLAALKGETPSIVEDLSEPVPITPVEELAAPTPATSGKTYTVEPGDGLMKIARKTNCKAADIAAVNGMTMDSVIKIGQVLKLPATATTSVAATPATDLAANAPKAAVVEESPAQTKTYTIQEGETYYSISRRLKIPVDDLIAANPKAPANRLYTGRKINLPVKGAVPAPAISAPETTPDSTLETAATEPAAVEEPAAPVSEPAPATEKKIIAVSVEEEISYGDFAAKHGTDVERLNSLNDLNLTSATILAKGSELYVPAATTTASN